ncbi:MAG: protoporphyrinogen oxidase HemJ [Candidatus Symbiobacter sp.]|nr:protoporphyrinogen oxidase HemJ [Candidatus Symbiobacter sp.]
MAWIKAFHIISVIAFMAGMLYLPRLFVYHASVPAESDRAAMLSLMEARLYRYIITPAMLAMIGFGLVLTWDIGRVIWQQPWFIAKITLVIAMFAYHGLLGRWRRHFAQGKNRHSAKFFRAVNEIPTLLMIIIVILVVVKPF